MSLAVIHPYEVPEDLAGRRPDQGLRDRFRQWPDATEIAMQNGVYGLRVRRHPQTESLIPVERHPGHEPRIVRIRIAMRHGVDGIARRDDGLCVDVCGCVHWFLRLTRRLELRPRPCFGYDQSMVDTPPVASIAALVADPSRASMLNALMDGRALTATELALEAGVTPSTASSHLSQLAQAGVVSMARQGRHRYFRIASPEVATFFEALMGLAARSERRPQRSAPDVTGIRRARVCMTISPANEPCNCWSVCARAVSSPPATTLPS